tara:strand:+ start:1291 stop:1875 length:585 start_codon:yes stop_codon:yes gene_type:complete
MRTPVFALAVAAALGLSACTPTLADDVDLSDVAPADIAWIGETPVYPNATIAENIAAAEVFSHLEVLVERVGLVETLGGDGPYTIFAPTDSAFNGVSEAVRAELARPENAAQLREVVAGHVVPERIFAADLMANIEAGGGSYDVTTLSGSKLTFRMDGPSIRISGPKGDGVLVTQADIVQANGMMHVIDGVLLP